jgi:hypothetical protein
MRKHLHQLDFVRRNDGARYTQYSVARSPKTTSNGVFLLVTPRSLLY